MASKHKKAAAARARAGRAAAQQHVPLIPSSPEPLPEIDSTFSPVR